MAMREYIRAEVPVKVGDTDIDVRHKAIQAMRAKGADVIRELTELGPVRRKDGVRIRRFRASAVRAA